MLSFINPSTTCNLLLISVTRCQSSQKRHECALDRPPAIMSFFCYWLNIYSNVLMFLSLLASLNDPQMLLRSVFFFVFMSKCFWTTITPPCYNVEMYIVMTDICSNSLWEGNIMWSFSPFQQNKYNTRPAETSRCWWLPFSRWGHPSVWLWPLLCVHWGGGSHSAIWDR